MTNKEVGVRLKVGADGLENVSKLSDELREAGVSTEQFDARAKALAADLDRLAGEQGLLDQFERQKAAVLAAGEAMDAARAQAAQLAREIAATAAPTQEQAAAFERATAAARTADAAYEAERAELQRLQPALAAAGVASEGLAAAQARNTQQTSAARAQLEGLQQELTAQRDAYAGAGAAAQGAAAQQVAAAQNIGQAGRAAREAVQALGQELTELGGDASAATAQAARLVTELERLGSERAGLEQFRQQRAAVLAAGEAMDQARGQAQQLGREIAATAAPTQAQAAALDRANTAARAAEVAYQAQRAELDRLRPALAAAGVAEDGLTAAQQRNQAQTTAARAGLADVAQQLQAQRNAYRDAIAQIERQTAAVEASSLAADINRARFQLLGREVGATAAPTQLQAAAMERAAAAARAADAAFDAERVALEQLRAQLLATGVSVDALAAAEARVRQQAAGARDGVTQLTFALQNQAVAYRGTGDAAAAAGLRQTTAAQAVQQSLSGIQTQLQRLQNISALAIGGGIFGGLIGDISRTSDAYANLQARIRLVTGEGAEFQAAFDGVQQIALRTNSALDTTGTLFARIAQAEALQLTETINQAVQLSGASTQAGNAAITQLIQGLQSGVLRGEEFNSVMEQAPRLALALASGLGITTGELRKLADAGQLTSQQVITALRGQSQAVQADFDQLPLTVGRAITNVRSQFELYIGTLGQGSGASRSAAEAIQFLGNNLDTLGNALFAAGKAAIAYKAIELGSTLLRYAASAGSATAATTADTAATTGNTAARGANAQAANTAAASVARAAVATVADTTATVANTAATVANTGARAGNAAALSQLGAGLASMAASRRAATAAEVAAGAATAAGAANTAALGAAAARTGGLFNGLSGVVAGFSRVLAGVLGPAGLIIGAVASFDLLKDGVKFAGTAIGEGAAKLLGYGKVIEEHERLMRAQEEASRRSTAARQAEAQAAQLAAEKALGLNNESRALLGTFDEVSSKGKGAAESLEAVQKALRLGDIKGIADAGAALDALAQKGKISAQAVRSALAGALDGLDLGVFVTQAQAAFDGTEQGARRLAAAIDASVSEALRRTGVDMRELQTGISAAATSAINDFDLLTASVDKLKAQGIDTDRALAAALDKALAAANTQKAVDAVIERVNALGAAGVLSASQVNDLFDKANQKVRGIEDATVGIQSLGEAARRAGIEAGTLTTGVSAAFETVLVDLSALRAEIDKAGISAERASPLLAAALDQKINAAKTREEIALLRAETDKLRDSGQLLGADYTQALDKIKTKAQELDPVLKGLQADAKSLGVAINTELRRSFEEIALSYERLKNSGRLSADELRTAFVNAANQMIRANSGIVPEWVKVEAAMRGAIVTVDQFGKATVAATNAGADGYDKLTGKINRSAEAVRNLNLTLIENGAVNARNAQVTKEIDAAESARQQRNNDALSDLSIADEQLPNALRGDLGVQTSQRRIGGRDSLPPGAVYKEPGNPAGGYYFPDNTGTSFLAPAPPAAPLEPAAPPALSPPAPQQPPQPISVTVEPPPAAAPPITISVPAPSPQASGASSGVVPPPAPAPAPAPPAAVTVDAPAPAAAAEPVTIFVGPGAAPPPPAAAAAPAAPVAVNVALLAPPAPETQPAQQPPAPAVTPAVALSVALSAPPAPQQPAPAVQPAPAPALTAAAVSVALPAAPESPAPRPPAVPAAPAPASLAPELQSVSQALQTFVASLGELTARLPAPSSRTVTVELLASGRRLPLNGNALSVDSFLAAIEQDRRSAGAVGGA